MGLKKFVKKSVKSVGKTFKSPSRLITKSPAMIGAGLLLGGKMPGVSSGVGSYGELPTSGTLSAAEQRAGITAPQYESMRDPATGELLSKFKVDPSKLEAYQKIKEQAFSQGPSAWANIQTGKQALEESAARDLAAKQQAQAIAQAQSGLMRFGGMGGGARERMAMQGARDMSRAQQELTRQGIGARLGISEQDEAKRQQALAAVGDREAQLAGQELGTTLKDVEQKRAFDLERYAKQMEAYGAEQGARAQERAAQASKPKGLLGAVGGMLGK